MTDAPTIRPAIAADRPALRVATIEPQEYERRRHDTRLPGELIADDYLDWMWRRSDAPVSWPAKAGYPRLFRVPHSKIVGGRP
jgi:hypothetical protein